MTKYDKYIYLKELDSIKESAEEQEAGENALFDAVVYKGKIVVLTYNQITDSIVLLHCIKNEKAFQTLLELFKDKKLVVNQFIDNYNISKYIQDNYNSKTTFKSSYFHFLCSYDKSIQNTVSDSICDAIRYGDKLYCNDLSHLLSETDLKSVFTYIDFILTINSHMNMHNCYIKPKEKALTANHQINNYLEDICQYLESLNIPLNNDLRILLDTHTANNKRLTRSEYLDTLSTLIDIDNKEKVEEIIHLAYNYTLGYSVSNDYTDLSLKEDLITLINTKITHSAHKKMAEVKCNWEIGYKLTCTAHTITTNLFNHLAWNTAVYISPFFELSKIMLCLIYALIIALLLNYISIAENIWSSIQYAGLLTFLYNITIDEIKGHIENKFPKWIDSSNFFKQFKQFIQACGVAWKRR